MDDLASPGTGAPQTTTAGRATRADVIAAILDFVRNNSPRELERSEFQKRQQKLYSDALALFGAWEVAVGAALREVIDIRRPRAFTPLPKPHATPSSDLPPVATTRIEGRPPMRRQPHPRALRSAIVLSMQGYILRVGGPAFFASELPTDPAPIETWSEVFGAPYQIIDLDFADTVVAVARDGRLFDCSTLQIPDARLGSAARRLGARHSVRHWCTILDLTVLRRAQLFIHATRNGRLKATPASLLSSHLEEQDGTAGFGLEDGDAAVGVWLGERADSLLLGASDGRILRVDLTGVKAQDAGDIGEQLPITELVTGTLSSRGPDVVIVTKSGRARRCHLDDLEGVDAVAVPDGDQLLALLACNASTDLVFTTNRGRALRIPTPTVFAGAPDERGELIIELEAGEHLTSVGRLLPLAYSNTSPHAFDI